MEFTRKNLLLLLKTALKLLVLVIAFGLFYFAAGFIYFYDLEIPVRSLGRPDTHIIILVVAVLYVFLRRSVLKYYYGG